MNISVTERGTFKRCRRMWDYNSFNRQGLQRIISKGALATGRLVHQALASWLLHPEESLESLYLGHAYEELENVKANYLKQVGAPINDVELGNVYDAIMAGHSIMQKYEEYYGTPIPSDYTLVSPEQQLTIQIPGTEHYLEGKLDGIIQHSNGMMFVLEHKTFSMMPKETDLQMNDQFLAYTWLLSQYVGRRQVGGLLYDGMSKKASKNPFVRFVILRAPEELDEFEQNLRWEVEDMASARIYPNRQWNGCWDCDYQQLCAAQSRGEDVEYLKSQFFTSRPHDDDPE